MVVRLLPKSEIDKRKAEQQRQEITEGLKVANRVDTLREIRASEETAFEKWKKDTISLIQSEINAKYSERDALAGEIMVLESERKSLQEPLDAEWTKVESSKEEVNRLGGILRKREFDLNQKEGDVLERERQIPVEEKRIETLNLRASQNLLKSESIASQTKKESEELIRGASLKLAEAEIRDKELTERERISIEQSNQLSEKETNLLKREQELRDGQRTLQDKYATLARTMNRLHGKRS